MMTNQMLQPAQDNDVLGDRDPFEEQGGRESVKNAVRAELEQTGKNKRRFWKTVLVIALVVLAVSLVALGAIALSYFQGQQKYGEIAEKAGPDPNDAPGDVGKLTVDWDALREANPDVVAWVYIPNSVINYPVVQGDDNEYYLYRDFDGDAGWLAEYGAIFLDYQNNPDWSDVGNFIYGHHMNDGSMFADISAMQDQAKFDACRTVYLLTPEGNFKLRSFSLVHCDPWELIVWTAFDNKTDMQDYLQDKMDRSVVDVGTVPKADQIDRFFAFATCDNYSAGRYVLYTYVEDTTLADLEGAVGIKKKKGDAKGFVDDLSDGTSKSSSKK